ncbi:hypothetical protein QVD17_17566 [Tagetes erecta]|uniref:Uncharacterized protein n=1 Tax=Tagetes erecta TaxID=13708 RepID=A0AAD8KWY5_TARER|nr:hypothetical protein QVD17_17566 [Tagetes erecta]
MFVRCRLAVLVWSKILGWCNAPNTTFVAVKEVLSLHESWAGDERYKDLLHVIYLSSWSLFGEYGKRRTIESLVIRSGKTDQICWMLSELCVHRLESFPIMYL